MASEQRYSMTISLNILEELGINLYSNVPAVLAEAVANSWDADAENIWIDIDSNKGEIQVTDDGHGMTEDDVNGKYLCVGYHRRDSEPKTPRFGRPVMGRKGIGKLSLFSIANVVDVFSVRDGSRNAFRMEVEGIRKAVRKGALGGTYHPTELQSFPDDLERGTRLVLTGLKKRVTQAAPALRMRIARRFSVIGDRHNFKAHVDGDPITVGDRAYYRKVEYLWTFGDSEEDYGALCSTNSFVEKRSGEIAVGRKKHQVSGWIGTVRKPSELADPDGSLSRIVVLMRGKLAQEDILGSFTEGQLFTKYLIGELHADFLDLDDSSDIATPNRSQIIEESDRYRALRDFARQELGHIAYKWSQLRNKGGTDKALENEAIREWFDRLPQGAKKHAQDLFGRIYELTVESEEERMRLFQYGVVAFESLRYKHQLDALQKLSLEDLETFAEVFGNLDDIEATLYYQIIKERLSVVEVLQQQVEDDVREKVIQKHLFDHLWLLDPTWERGTETPMMESSVAAEFGKINAKLTQKEKRGRIDIKYKEQTGKHVIVELKKASVKTSASELMKQVDKYRIALIKLLAKAGKDTEQVEVVCVLGQALADWTTHPDAKRESERALEAKSIRVVLYQQLIERAYRAYQSFLEKKSETDRLAKLVESISDEP